MRAIRPLALILACFLAGMVVVDYMLPWLWESSTSTHGDHTHLAKSGHAVPDPIAKD
jgi:hypothetical protein